MISQRISMKVELDICNDTNLSKQSEEVLKCVLKK